MNNPIGILIGFKHDTDLEQEFRKAQELGLESCQVNIWDAALYTDENASKFKDAMNKTGFQISAIWAGWSGPKEWNFTYGPSTLGLVPAAYRDTRLRELKQGADFAAKIGVDTIITHVGYIPENPNDPDFAGVVSGLRWLCKLLKERGQYFLFET